MVKSKVHYTENHGKLKIEYKEANSRGKKTFCLMSQSFDKDCLLQRSSPMDTGSLIEGCTWLWGQLQILPSPVFPSIMKML